MQHSNSIELRVWGRYAMFSDPITRGGGEKINAGAYPAFAYFCGFPEIGRYSSSSS